MSGRVVGRVLKGGVGIAADGNAPNIGSNALGIEDVEASVYEGATLESAKISLVAFPVLIYTWVFPAGSTSASPS
jgi:hypothetical protein